jgi:predicted nucleic acid-binding protein
VPRRRRVFIDTSELYPFTIMDVLLTMSENFLFTWVWTDELLDEWERVIVEGEQRNAESARSVTDAVRSWFKNSRLDPAEYRNRVSDDLSPDPDDRIHVAACLDGRADVLLTRNTKDFPLEKLAAAGVQVVTADDFLVDLLRRRPKAVQEAFVATAATRNRPPVTACELVDRIGRAGTPKFASRMRRRLGCS